MENVDDDELLVNPDETSSDTFSFEDSSQTESQISQTSTDLSSSLDEFALQRAEIKIDKNVEDKMKDRISKEKRKGKEVKDDEPKGVIFFRTFTLWIF